MNPAERTPAQSGHEAVWELLPWYHNDGLEDAERAQVENHLRECLTCSREVRHLRQLGMAIATPASEHACAQAFQRLTAEIDAREHSWRERLRGWLVAMLAPAPLLATLAVVGLATMLLWNAERSNGKVAEQAEKQFQTLGRHDSRESSLELPLLRVVLKDSLKEQDRQAWLNSHDAELMDGPSDIGVMTVRLNLGPRSITTVLGEMRAEADTLFVEPLRNTGTRPDRRR